MVIDRFFIGYFYRLRFVLRQRLCAVFRNRSADTMCPCRQSVHADKRIRHEWHCPIRGLSLRQWFTVYNSKVTRPKWGPPWRVRDAHAPRFNYDLDAIFLDIKKREKESGLNFVLGVARQPLPDAERKAERKEEEDAAQ